VAANPVPLLDPCKAANGEEAGGSCDDLRCAHQRGRPEEGAMTCAAPLLPDAAMGKAAALGWPELGCMLHRAGRGVGSTQAAKLCMYLATATRPHVRCRAAVTRPLDVNCVHQAGSSSGQPGCPFRSSLGEWLHHKRCGTVVAYYESVSSNRFFCSYPMER
jgi:hypothetical protein